MLVDLLSKRRITMRMRLLALAIILALLPRLFAQNVNKVPCDRACLENYVDRYMDAMLANDPSLDLFARDCKFTENGAKLPLGGEGLWFGMSGKGTYKFYIPDIETQQIAFIGTAREGSPAPGSKLGEGTPVAIALRLKILNGLITEAEQIVVRPETNLMGGGSGSKFPPAAMAIEKVGSPHKVYSEVIPEAERPSREEMIKTANYYFTGLQRNDGKGYYPFTDDCDRLENGMQTTNIPMEDPETGQTVKMGCKEQFEKGLKNVVSRIRDRRFVAVDRERGIVFAFTFFDHENINWTWEIAELFKVEKGLIRRIEAVFHRCPYGMNSGWSTYEQGMLDQIQSIR
jgi:hypothetical protein